MLNKSCLIAVTTCSLLACTQEQHLSASDTFLNYHELSKSNKDFSVETSFYSQTQAAKLKSKIPNYMESMKVATEGEAISKYLQFVSETAKCMNLTLLEDQQTVVSAEITYAVIDLCSGHEGATQKVSMIYESGWKIESTELVL